MLNYFLIPRLTYRKSVLLYTVFSNILFSSMNKIKEFLSAYFRITLPLLPVFLLFRIYEYCTAGIKLSVSHGLMVVFAKAFYFDISVWLIYNGVLLLPFLLVYMLRKKAGEYLLHVVNILTVIGFFGLLSVFSERLVPFDHELFVRHISESFSTVREVVTGRYWIALPIFLYLAMYLGFYKWVSSKIRFSNISLIIVSSLVLLFSICYRLSAPSIRNYEQIQEYYLVSNKLQFFVSDSYKFLFRSKKYNLKSVSTADIDSEVATYQKFHNLQWVDNDYPLLHEDKSKDVLHDFLRSSDTVPNIVIIIFEGLSRDFSGDDAIAGSFTPFLDSLGQHSLTWYNCLSNAQGTFGSAPSIVGSLPFGNRGFTLMTVPPEHISLIKILKRNNWQSFYFTGAELNFDNFGSFFRLQGTDFILTRFGPKYHRMGLDKNGLSCGYPDDALFERSIQVLDSMARPPYISVYLTVTTHSPFIFDQSKAYEKLFEKRMNDWKLPESKKRNLRLYTPLWASFLFSDNCVRNFFAAYKKRKDFKNTIFIITGDHHHGFYPTRNEIDDYNVPLIIYSPLLKKPVKFNSVNSHINIAPTLLAYLKNSCHLKYYPRYVSWLGNELDTCRTFRNIHHLPFMLCNRDINDYLSGNLYVGDQLYRLKPGLNLEVVDNQKMLDSMVRVRENFKFVNAYVCQQNKLFPVSENIYDVKPIDLQTFTDTTERFIPEHIVYQYLVKGFKPPTGFKKIIVKVSYQLQFDSTQFELLPHLFTYIFTGDNKKELLCSTKNTYEFVKIPKKNEWASYTDEDLFDLENYPYPAGHLFKVAFYNHDEIKMKIKGLTIKFLGIK